MNKAPYFRYTGPLSGLLAAARAAADRADTAAALALPALLLATAALTR